MVKMSFFLPVATYVDIYTTNEPLIAYFLKVSTVLHLFHSSILYCLRYCLNNTYVKIFELFPAAFCKYFHCLFSNFIEI
jgi:hypothetical protein